MSEEPSTDAEAGERVAGGPIACSIVSNNYLPFARVLARSFLEHHPEGRVIVCIVDRRHPDLRYRDEPFEVIFADELAIPNFDNFAFRYSILELNTAVKPFLLQVLHERTGCSQLCYFDPDIMITDDLSDLYRKLSTADVVLTPHILEPIDDKASPSERDFLLSGSYNLGFLGIRFQDTTARFLSWWQDRLYQQCLHQVENGLFVDQRWMDLAPAFLEDAVILHDPGYNVAYWNLVHRRLEEQNDGLWVGGSRLRFFHFSGFHPDRLDTISKYQDRFELAERPDLLPLFEDYRDRLLNAGYRQLIELPYGYAEFDNGVPIPQAARSALQTEDPEGRRWSDPFASSGVASFFAWLKAPRSVRGAGLPIPRVAFALWRIRDDLREAFPEPSGADREGFVEWLLASEDLPQILLETLRTTWAESVKQRRQVRKGRGVEFDNGVAAPGRLAQILDQLDPHGSRWPLPLSTRDSGNLYDFLSEAGQADHRLPRFAHCIWRLRRDLQEVFPNPEKEQREAFAQWLLTFGVQEEGLDAALLRPVRTWLSQKRRCRVRACLAAGSPEESKACLRALANEDLWWAMQPAELELQGQVNIFATSPLIPRWGLILHGLRADVRKSFPQPLDASRRQFATWLVTDGRVEFGVPRRLLMPTLQSLPWSRRIASELHFLRRRLPRMGQTQIAPRAEASTALEDARELKVADGTRDLRRILSEAEQMALSVERFVQIISVPENVGAATWVDNGRALELAATRNPSPALVDHFGEVEPIERLLQLPTHSVSFLFVGELPASLPRSMSSLCLWELLRVATPRGLVAFDVPVDEMDDWTERIESLGGRVLECLAADSEDDMSRLVVRKVIPASPGLAQSPPRAEERPSRLVQAQPARRDWSQWLRAVDDVGNDLEPMNVFSLCLWRSNAYFQKRFPIDTKDGKYRFQYWLAWINESSLPIQNWILGIDWNDFERPVESLTEAGEPEIRLFDWLVWTLRPKVRRAFPLDTRQGRDGFRGWIAKARNGEHAEDVTRIRARRGEVEKSGAQQEGPPSAVGTFLPGVHVVEHPGATLGVLEVTHMNQLALERAGVPHNHFQFFNPQRRPDWAEQSFRYTVNLIHCNADQMLRAFGQLGPQLWDGRLNIGYLWWELPFCPPEWHAALDLLDEIWVATRFVYDAFATVSPIPVLHMPCAVRAEPEPGVGRSQFGLPEGPYLFVSTFDVSSFAARKNPMAAVHAFRAAFPSNDRGVGLVIKAAHASKTGWLWRELEKRAAEDPRIHVINELMPRERVLSLVNCCDAYVSLHRSEGLGLGPAEALLLGKPIVVTAYSGNMDYSSPETACLVDYDLVGVGGDEYPFGAEQVWADPNIDSAVDHMRNLRWDRAGARETAVEGRRFVRHVHGLDAVGRRYRDRLSALGIR